MISVYRENGKCGLRCDGSVMLQPVFDEIGDFVGDYAIATLFDRNRMMTVQYVVMRYRTSCRCRMFSSLAVLLRVLLMSFWKLLPIIFLSFVLILVVKVML